MDGVARHVLAASDAIVDTHVHVTSADTARYPLAKEPRPGASWFVDRPLDVDGLLRDMDDAGVDQAVVVQGLGPYAYDDRYLLDAIARDRARLVGVVGVDPTDPAAPRAIATFAAHPQVRAVRLPAGTACAPDWLRDRRADALWGAAAESGLSLVLWIRESELAAVAAVARRHPDVAVALDHCGGATFRRERGEVDASALAPFVPLESVHLKVTTAVFDAAGVADDPAPLVSWLNGRFGSRRLMWGSNHPASGGRSYREMRELAERSVRGLKAAEGSEIFGGTAATLYALRRGSPGPP